MRKEEHRIHELLSKYRKNRCSREEYEELIVLAQIAGNDMIIKEVMLKDWQSQESEMKIVPQIQLLPTQKNRRMFLRIAAVLAILVTTSLVLIQWFSNNPIKYATGNGEVMEVILPDGTVVTLNANSNLSWIPASNTNGDRVVQLSGEAFFDVAKVPASGGTEKRYRGFQVQTPNMTVHVLGTIFNVVARQVNTEVFLQEGAVELQLPEVKEVLKRMVPGDKVVMDNQTGEITERESENLLTSASWVTGILNYQDKSLGEVLNNLSELFGVEITCEIPALHKKKINLGVPYMDWENTRKALEMSLEVEFRKEGESYRVEYKDQKNVK